MHKLKVIKTILLVFALSATVFAADVGVEKKIGSPLSLRFDTEYVGFSLSLTGYQEHNLPETEPIERVGFYTKVPTFFTNTYLLTRSSFGYTEDTNWGFNQASFGLGYPWQKDSLIVKTELYLYEIKGNGRLFRNLEPSITFSYEF